MSSRRYWLVKSEATVFSFDDLRRAEDATTCWDGVRNYQARNFLRDEMKLGDRVLYYHSNADPPQLAGIAEVVRAGYPEPAALDPKHKYYDPESDPADPRWYGVDLRAVAALPRPVTLQELKDNPKLGAMKVVQRGQRLSVQPVLEPEYREVLRMAGMLDP
jgi:predicted RNA-binding protein with PUA-like domain